jgi:hypothetical protein
MPFSWSSTAFLATDYPCQGSHPEQSGDLKRLRNDNGDETWPKAVPIHKDLIDQ